MKTTQQHDLSERFGYGDYVEFFRAGSRTRGVFQCVSCQGVVLTTHVLEPCRACGEEVWERADWSPFHRGS